jgi:hypothetical protein
VCERTQRMRGVCLRSMEIGFAKVAVSETGGACLDWS